MPGTLPTAERMTKALAPFRDLIDWVDSMGDLASLEQALGEKRSAVDAAQKDLETKGARIVELDKAISAAEAKRDAATSEAQTTARESTNAANAAAAKIVADARAKAEQILAEANTELEQVRAAKTAADAALAETTRQHQAVRQQLSGAKAEMAAIKSKLG